MDRPELVVLDVNETLSDLTGLHDVLSEVGLGPDHLEPWFAGVLRDAFALTVLGECPAFADIGSALLRGRLAAAGADDPDGGAQRVMQRFTELDPHPDVSPGLVAIAGLGCRVVTLSNGAASVAESLLRGTPAADVVQRYLSVADAGAWKPDPRAYRHALEVTGVEASRAMLVAVHPWDIAGARAAGLATAWINRDGAPYPDHVATADVEARSFEELAGLLA